jgi:sigma-B regulation protein RsbU (phosphoserine phosphatase)
VASSDLLSSQRTELAALARDWLACGAESFTVWSDGRPLHGWPDGRAPGTPTLLAPIRVGARVIGELRVAGLGGAAEQARLGAEARMLARVVGLEAEFEQMTAELVEAQDQLLAMYELTQATRSHLTLGETLRRLAHEAARLVKSTGAMMLLAPALVQYPAALVDDLALLGYVERVRESGRELLLSASSAEVLPDGLENILVVPIRVRGQITAALGLLNRLGGFLAPDLKLARAIAEHAGAQLEHAILYDERLAQARLHAEMEIARKVQLQMLPQTRPREASLEIFAESRPALQVGGDFYDFVAAPDRPLMVMLGDVAGKGMSAALIMGMIHAITHSAARFMPKPTPASVLGRANEDLYDDLTKFDAFVTAFAAQYDAREHMLRYANAGHAPVIYCPAGGPARILEADSVPIGVLPISLSENYTLPFGAGDLLVVTTDGFNEASDAGGELFGYERLLSLVEEFSAQPVQVIAYALFDAVDSFAAGRPQDDDQTLIILKGVAP